MQSFSINWISETLIRVGSIAVGVFLYSFLIILSIDILRSINHFIPFFPEFITIDYTKTKLITGSITILIALVIVAYGLFHAKDTKIVNLDIKSPKISESGQQLNIVALSDIHLGTIINQNDVSRMIRIVNALNPDIVLIAGDLVDNNYKVAIYYNLFERFKEIKSKYGIYSCLGNHDYISSSYKHLQEIEKYGIRILRDTKILIDNRFYLIGRDDISANTGNHNRKTIDQLMAGIDLKKPIIVLDHQPYNLKQVSKYPIDFQFSGHTHRGQFWPFTLITRRIFEKDWGFVKFGNINFYISSGFGNAVSPIRICTQSEIVNIKLH